MAGVMQSIGLINFEVYKSGSDRLIGIANVELPTMEYETVDMKGAGLSGTMSMPVRGNFSSMELKLTWRSIEAEATELFGHKSINLSLYGAVSREDSGTHDLKVQRHKLEVSVLSKTLNLGKWEPSSTTDSESTFELQTLNYKIDGKEVLDIDRLNYVFKVFGTDYSRDTRTALGL